MESNQPQFTPKCYQPEHSSPFLRTFTWHLDHIDRISIKLTNIEVRKLPRKYDTFTPNR